MKFLKTACLSVALGLLASNFYAQEKTDGPFKLAIKAKSSNISKGGEVTDNFNVTGDIKFSTKDDLFTIGVFSGSSIAKDYKEFNYYASFSKYGFKLTVDDIFNFSEKNVESYNVSDAFNYNAGETGRFIDLSLEYQFSESFPLKLHWNTIVFGNDRGVVNKKRTIGNRYSTYVSAYYPVIQGEKVNITAGVGGAFAFKSKKLKKSLYGDTAGIINVELTASRDIEIFDYKLPVSVSGIWNPQAQKTYMQIAFDLIRF